MSTPARVNKARAYFEFLAAVLYFFVVRSFAHRAAFRIQNDAWAPLLEEFLLAFLARTEPSTGQGGGGGGYLIGAPAGRGPCHGGRTPARRLHDRPGASQRQDRHRPVLGLCA